MINELLHATAAILLWQVLLRLQVPGAWLAAIIFALHPVEVESVSWITERKNVLSAVFYFAAALAYLRFVALAEPGGPNRLRWYGYLGALVLFIVALLSKTVTCSLPAALWLVCWWKKGRGLKYSRLPDSGGQQGSEMILVEKWVHFPAATANLISCTHRHFAISRPGRSAPFADDG